jgi:hypothetical protein
MVLTEILIMTHQFKSEVQHILIADRTPHIEFDSQMIFLVYDLSNLLPSDRDGQYSAAIVISKIC